MGQQFYFFIDPTGIACQISVSPDDTMARNDDGNGIVPHCAAHRLLPDIRSLLWSMATFWANSP